MVRPPRHQQFASTSAYQTFREDQAIESLNSAKGLSEIESPNLIQFVGLEDELLQHQASDSESKLSLLAVTQYLTAVWVASSESNTSHTC